MTLRGRLALIVGTTGVVLFLGSGNVSAQTIAACPDCMCIIPCFFCNTICECCFYEQNSPPSCSYLRDRGYWDEETSVSPCHVRKQYPDGNDSCASKRCFNYGESPIFIPLGQGLPEFSSPQNGVFWDFNGNGKVVRAAWPVDPKDVGWLALDRNNNGVVDDGTELFGNTRRLANGQMATHGYEVLAELDSNGDRLITKADPAFTKLLIWRDYNRDGLSTPDELQRAEELGVRALSTEPHQSRRSDEWGNQFRYEARVRAAKPIEYVTRSIDVFLTTIAVTGVTLANPDSCPILPSEDKSSQKNTLIASR